MITIYGKFKTGYASENYIIGVDMSYNRILTKNSNQPIKTIPVGVEWCEELKDKHIKTLKDLDFEIRNFEIRKENPDFVRARLFVGEGKWYDCLIHKFTLMYINKDKEVFIECKDGGKRYDINSMFVREIEFLDKENQK